MKIGLTYDLRQEYLDLGYGMEETAEFDKPDTIEGIEGALRELGYQTERIGSYRSLVRALAEGRRYELVFNIAEGLHGYGRESLVPCLLDAYRIPYTFSDPLVLALSLHKEMCKRVVRDAGVPTPRFALVEDMADVESVALSYPLFAKPVAEGTGKGITATSKVESPGALAAVCSDLLSRFLQPVLVEEYLPGREFTVGIVGTGGAARSLGCMEVLVSEPTSVYSYTNKEHYEDRVAYGLLRGERALEQELDWVALSAWRCLGCRDGGRVDLRLDQNGKAHFIEVNPLAGLNPVHSDLPILCRLNGISYVDLLGMIMDSTMARCRDEGSNPARRTGG